MCCYTVCTLDSQSVEQFNFKDGQTENAKTESHLPLLSCRKTVLQDTGLALSICALGRGKAFESVRLCNGTPLVIIETRQINENFVD